MRNIVIAVLICTVHLFGQVSDPQKGVAADPWKPLQFLVGTWEAKTAGGSAGAVSSGTYAFQMELKNHVMVRRTFGGQCKGPADFNCEHNDVLYTYIKAPGERWKAIFFDNEGHVIYYNVSVPRPNNVVFSSDAVQPGPAYRLSYELKDKELSGKFEMRLPGQSVFTSYLEWSGGRK